MDVRKIIEFGRGSYVVSLPKGWLDKNKLRKGDVLNATQGLNEVIFSTSQIKPKSDPIKITIVADEKDMTRIEAEIVSAYLNNADSIEVLSKNLRTNAMQIKNILRNLSGMEILEQTSSKIFAKNLINLNEIALPTIIRRMDIITRGMIEDSIKSFEENYYESIRTRDWDVNRLFYLASRVIRAGLKDHREAQRLNTSPLELQTSHLMILRLEKVADRQKRIARELQGCTIPIKLKVEIHTIYTEIKDKYLEVMKAYYTKNKELAFTVEVTNKDRIDRLNAIQDKLNNPKCTRIIENLKATTAEIRSMAKTVVSME